MRFAIGLHVEPNFAGVNGDPLRHQLCHRIGVVVGQRDKRNNDQSGGIGAKLARMIGIVARGEQKLVSREPLRQQPGSDRAALLQDHVADGGAVHSIAEGLSHARVYRLFHCAAGRGIRLQK